MHVEEVDRDRQRKDDSQRHMEVNRDRHARGKGGQRQTEEGWIGTVDIWRVNRDRHARG
jgi:hypothetical protein